ncbi:Rv0361 family membrane protein [Actinoplanes sp. HUAS TT8]|uniref:Rv0361 family membrane protein n=1 Tax=Actinoplanes sp. HUAS TT8 TaxID=3447453 RepID=UPI003F522C82
MQPHEPNPGAEPASSSVPSVPAREPKPGGILPEVVTVGADVRPKRRGRLQSRRARLWLALGIGVAALLCLGGVGVFVALYDSATKIERSDPSVVMVNFLGAYMAHRDDQDAALYTCKSGSDLSKLNSFRNEIQAAEDKYSIQVVVTWRNLNVQTSGDRAVATVDIVRTVSDGSERTFDPWRFDLFDDGDWRVCSAAPGP